MFEQSKNSQKPCIDDITKQQRGTLADAAAYIGRNNSATLGPLFVLLLRTKIKHFSVEFSTNVCVSVRVDAYHVTSLEPFEFFSKGSIFGHHLVSEDTDNSREAPQKIYTAYLICSNHHFGQTVTLQCFMKNCSNC